MGQDSRGSSAIISSTSATWLLKGTLWLVCPVQMARRTVHLCVSGIIGVCGASKDQIL